jgi:hypothetical protein
VGKDNHHRYDNMREMARKLKAAEKRAKRQSRTTEKPKAETVGAKDRTQYSAKQRSRLDLFLSGHVIGPMCSKW